jgi:hypothetical protein
VKIYYCVAAYSKVNGLSIHVLLSFSGGCADSSLACEYLAHGLVGEG